MFVKLHYQIYSCALKYLLNNCKKEGEREGEKEGGGEGGREGEGEGEREGEKEENLAVVMADCQGLPLGRVGYEGVREWVRAVLRGQSGQYYKVDAPLHYGADIVSRLVQKIIADAEREVAMEIAMEAGTGNYLEQQQSSTCPETTPPETTHPGLLEQCMYGVGVCSVRCPAYYKSIYRLASTFHSLGHSQVSELSLSLSLSCHDLLQVSRALLLGPLPQPLLMAQDKLQPLFLLKPNIFAVSYLLLCNLAVSLSLSCRTSGRSQWTKLIGQVVSLLPYSPPLSLPLSLSSPFPLSLSPSLSHILSLSLTHTHTHSHPLPLTRSFCHSLSPSTDLVGSVAMSVRVYSCCVRC